MTAQVLPTIVAGLPRCDSSCPSHNGKRCEILGHRPDAFCEPALMAIRGAVDELLAQSIDDWDACRICGGLNGSRKGHETNCGVVILERALVGSGATP